MTFKDDSKAESDNYVFKISSLQQAIHVGSNTDRDAKQNN
jgi:hypothetical protein